MKCPLWHSLAATAALALFLSACSGTKDAETQKVGAKTRQSDKNHSKISQPLRQTIMAIEQARQNADNQAAVDYSHLSSTRVKIDSLGRIQCYLHLNPFSQDHIAQLRNRQIDVEAVSEMTKIVQAWVPYGQITELEQLEFVAKITQPDYATSF